jgi:hypothetical protein
MGGGKKYSFLDYEKHQKRRQKGAVKAAIQQVGAEPVAPNDISIVYRLDWIINASSYTVVYLEYACRCLI